MSKSLFKLPITKEFLFELMYSPESRKSYDLSMKDFHIFEGNKECYAFHITYFSPIFFISERNTTDKRITFIHGETYHCFSSSLNEKVSFNFHLLVFPTR